MNTRAPSSPWIARLRGSGRSSAWVSVVAGGAALGIGLLTPSLTSNLTLWMTSALLALSLQFVWGNVGILSFAHGAFFGIGAYVYGVIGINAGVPGTTLLWTILAAAASALVAAGLGYVLFFGRLNEIAVAIITYAFALIVAVVATGVVITVGEASIGGANGLLGILPLAFGWGTAMTTVTPTIGLVITVACISAIWFALARLRNARYGRVLNGIRQNDERATLIGYDVRSYRLSAFALSGGVAGLAGALFAAWSQFVNPGQFNATNATLVVIWVLIGGRRSPLGCVIGAILISALQFALGSGPFAQYVTLALGIVAIAVILLAPDGLGSLGSKAVKRFQSTAATRRSAPSLVKAEASPTPSMTAEETAAPGNSAVLLDVRGVSKAYGGVKAVGGVHLTLHDRSVVCIIGPNGAGKSSLFNLLSGRVPLDKGSIVFDGRDISRLPAFARAREGIGTKLQTASIFAELSVHENVELAARSTGPHERSALVSRSITEVGLAEFADTEARNLSHGQQQWLEIAMVLAQRPRLILLDEPVAGMTVGERVETVRIIRRLSSSCGVIVVEHDMSVVEALDAEVIVMHEGRVLRTGRIDELKRDELVMDAYLGRDDSIEHPSHEPSTQGPEASS